LKTPSFGVVVLAACAAPHRDPGVTARPRIDSQPTQRTVSERARDDVAAPRARELLDAHENVGGVLSPDGTKLLFRSDRDGIAELYLADVAHPDAPATKIVAGPERVTSAVFARDGASVIFRKDTGANEVFHIYRADLDGSHVVDLTPPEPLWRDSPLLPGARPGLIVYGARDSRDPVPEQGFFLRSDQAPFARAGVPALIFRPGFLDRSGGSDRSRALFVRWRGSRWPASSTSRCSTSPTPTNARAGTLATCSRHGSRGSLEYG
jgi:hypothetical protein